MGDGRIRELVACGRIEEAVAALFAAHDADVRRYLGSRCPPGRVDDLGQEVWLAVREGLPRFRGQTSPRVWVLTIARNKAADEHRNRRRYETLESSLLDGGPLGSILGIRPAATPTRELRNRERAQALHRALAALTPGDRELLELRYVVGLKPAAIAQVLAGDVRANTVSQRLVRLVRRLRDQLCGEPVFSDEP